MEKSEKYEINPDESYGRKRQRSERNPSLALSHDKEDNAFQSQTYAKFETKGTFRSACSSFSMDTGRFLSVKVTQMTDFAGGIPLDWNKSDGIVYVDSTDSHTVIIGATGSKKSRLIAMPSVKILGSAGESMIICDPKAEIYHRTAWDLKRKGYDINVINLRNPERGSSWNPLSIPYQFYASGDVDRAYEFINDIATNLMLSEIATKDPYWDYSACNLFFGLTLLLFKLCKYRGLSANYANIGNLLALRREMFKGEDKHNVQTSSLWRFAELDDIIAANLQGIVVTPDKTMSCILSTFDQKLRCFMFQPNLIQMLSHNTVKLDTIGEQKTAFYLIMPDEKTSYHKLITIFIKQSYEYIIYNAQHNGNSMLPIRLNYILDEFTSLPAIGDFPTMITAARSRNIRFNLIVQSKHQLLQRYQDETETILSNCSNWIFLTSREISLLREISELCGTRKDQRQLVSVSFLQHLNKDEGEALVLSGRMNPYQAHLADIDFYDRGVYQELPLEFSRWDNNCTISSFKGLLEEEPQEQHTEFPAIESLAVQDKDVAQSELMEKERLQKELEAKFDELFGDLDDGSDEDTSPAPPESSAAPKIVSQRLLRKRKRQG